MWSPLFILLLTLGYTSAATHRANRAIDDKIVLNGQEKFAIYVGPSSGQRLMLIQELGGGVENMQPDGFNSDFYDDNSVVDPRDEKQMVIPKLVIPAGEGNEEPGDEPPFDPLAAQPAPPPRFEPPPVFFPAPTAAPPAPAAPPAQSPEVFGAATLPPVVFTPSPTTLAPPPVTSGIRSGSCPLSIFYKSEPVTDPRRIVFTHFALTVTVDQCARTCHEFNCAAAHYNPRNKRCQFNPATANQVFAGECPVWPDRQLRNNIVADGPKLRISCITCQRPRGRSVLRH